MKSLHMASRDWIALLLGAALLAGMIVMNVYKI